MDRPSVIICKNRRPHRRFCEISQEYFNSRHEAYQALDNWCKKNLTSSDGYFVVDGKKPRWKQEGFRNENEYLNYIAYTG